MRSNGPRNVAITAIGGYIPEEVLDNAYFESILDTTDEWIRTRSGVIERRKVPENEATSDLAVRAAKEMLEMRGLKLGDV